MTHYAPSMTCKACGDTSEYIDRPRSGLCPDCQPNPLLYLDAGWTRLKDIPATIERWQKTYDREIRKRAA